MFLPVKHLQYTSHVVSAHTNIADEIQQKRPKLVNSNTM